MKYINFNDLPTFHDALEDQCFDQDAVMLAGSVLTEMAVEEKYGICLLHRHFDMASDEVLTRFIDGDIIISMPVRVGATDWGSLVPSSWCADADGSTVVFDYTVGAPAINTRDVDRVLARFRAHGLQRVFGIYRRDLLPDCDDLLYEISDDDLRISLVSRWQDDTHEDGWYSQSTFTFTKAVANSAVQLTNAGIACANTTSCKGCRPSSPLLRRAVRQMAEDDAVCEGLSASNVVWVKAFKQALSQIQVEGKITR